MQVRPVVSTSPEEAKRAVLAAYRHWMKKSGRIWQEQNLQSTRLSVFRQAIKDQFLKNAAIKDLRIVDRLVYRSETEIAHCDIYATNWEHISNSLLKDHVRPKPQDFLSKFFAGKF